MPIVCVGLSHHTAPIEVRERHAFPASRMSEALVALRDYHGIDEATMLQTCGRLEIYADVEEYEEGIAAIKAFLSNFRHAATGYDIESFLYTHLGQHAVEHLLRVATGLDSMLIGEAEILGQVKEAYVVAQRAKSIGKTLHHLFREALRAGKAARSQTDIARASVSIATAAIDAAAAHLGSLARTAILVVGAGKMGRAALRRLRESGAECVMVANRTASRARELIAEAGVGEAVDFPGLVNALAAADLVFASTGASHFILNTERVREAMERRPQRPLLVIDIAVPRDADPEIALIPNVSLIDIDGLKTSIAQTLDARRGAIADVEEIVAEYAERFAHWNHSRIALPVISMLTQKAESIREAELERLFARCPELSERERMLITGATMTIVSKLLHSVILKIREKASLDRTEALSHARVLDELFELNLAEHIAGLVPSSVPADAGE
ncbi:MAG: glutamyl-tRNA reductase [Candidatus Eremiobacteraeota bacterium]|nr:glutamyl-tRNA reductase [Candidatus Eremiobacteraeota bacterium]